MRFSTALLLWGVFMLGAGAGLAVGARREPEPPAVEVHTWDLTDPWERCLAAMEEAEIPGDMWECHEPTK